jgi:hypothetical protein
MIGIMIGCAAAGAEVPVMPKDFRERAEATLRKEHSWLDREAVVKVTLETPRPAKIKASAVFEDGQKDRVYWAAKFLYSYHFPRSTCAQGSYGLILGDGEKYFTMDEDDITWVTETLGNQPNKIPRALPAAVTPKADPPVAPSSAAADR